MTDAVLVINAGSSSIKSAAFPTAGSAQAQSVIHARIEGIGGSEGRFSAGDGAGTMLADQTLDQNRACTHEYALSYLLDWWSHNAGPYCLVAAGHRVVHGGSSFSAPVRIDAEVISTLKKLVPLARLHQPYNLAAIEALARRQPDLPQVACFDTAFHSTQPQIEKMFGLPLELAASGIRRYGFHGLSYEYVAGELPACLGAKAKGPVVIAHLGNGASLCALLHGASVATTMGFTALDGLMMGTRCGSIDPGVLLYLLQEKGMDAQALSDLLYQRSGLLGVSGLSHDMRVLLASDSAPARTAVELFVHRCCQALAGMAASVGGIDALIFTGGIGEHAQPVRARICQQAAWLGIELDAAANAADARQISTSARRVSVWVIATNEEKVIARQTCRLLGLSGDAASRGGSEPIA